MTSMEFETHQENPLTDNNIFAAVVVLALPALLFSQMMPPGIPFVVTIGLLVFICVRRIAMGGFFQQTPLDIPLIILLILLPVGLWVTADPAITLPRIYTVVANVAILLAVAAQRQSPWLHYTGWLVLGGGLVLSILLVLGTNFTTQKLPFIDAELIELLPSGFRPFWNAGGFNPNLSGGLIALFWAPAAALIWYGSSWLQRDIAKVVAFILTVLLLLTQSRGAFLGVAVALVIITILHHRRWAYFWGIAFVGLVVALLLIGPTTLMDSFLGSSELFNRSFQGRQQLWQQATLIIRDSPLTGVGLGMFEPTIRELYPSENLINITEEFKHAHNLFLQTGAEMGIPGLLVHLALYGLLFYTGWQHLTFDGDRSDYRQGLTLGLFGSLIIFLTHGLFEVITYAPRAAIVVWALFGLLLAVRPRANASQEIYPDYYQYPSYYQPDR